MSSKTTISQTYSNPVADSKPIGWITSLLPRTGEPGTAGDGEGQVPSGLQIAAASTLIWMATVDEVTDALRDVIDPELGLDFVELGLIYEVDVDGSAVHVTYSLTSPGCPIGPQVSAQIEEFVSELDGVDDVQSTMTFTPPWTPEMMSEDAKFALGF